MELESKKQVRSWIKQEKSKMSELDITAKSQKITEQIIALKEYERCQNIFTYVNFNEEVVTTGLIEESFKRQKRVFVPKVFNDQKRYMEFLEIKSLSELENGYYGVPEPVGQVGEVTGLRQGLFIMPGLAFDRRFHRIGYGGGFYDRYLSAQHQFKTIAVGFDFQLLEQIPHEEFDLAPQMIITNKEVLKNRSMEVE